MIRNTVERCKVMNSINDIWNEIIKILSKQLTPTAITTWFSDCTPVEIDDCRLVIHTSNAFKKGIINNRFGDTIKAALSDIFSCEFDLLILAEDELSDYMSNKKDDNSLPEMAGYTFDRFIVGNSNKFAHAAAVAVAEKPGKTYNPLFIYGNSGLGKTHLLYAVINYIRKNHPNLTIVYKKSEDFINELISAIQLGDTSSFKNRYRTADVLLIDDIQFIAGKESTQEEFFHTFSALYEAGKQIILTSDRPPKEIKPLEDRLRTRFEGGLLADVQKPSFELRIAIINKKAATMNITISAELVAYMAERLQHDIRQIEGALKKLKAYALIGTDITKESIDEVITSIDPGNIPTDALVEKIIGAVAKYYGTNAEDIKSKKKNDTVANARHIAVYIIRQLTDLPFKKIGEIVGRDHSTIMSSINKVEINIKTKKNTDSDIKRIIKEIKSR